LTGHRVGLDPNSATSDFTIVHCCTVPEWRILGSQVIENTTSHASKKDGATSMKSNERRIAL